MIALVAVVCGQSHTSAKSGYTGVLLGNDHDHHCVSTSVYGLGRTYIPYDLRTAERFGDLILNQDGSYWERYGDIWVGSDGSVIEIIGGYHADRDVIPYCFSNDETLLDIEYSRPSLDGDSLFRSDEYDYYPLRPVW